MHLRRLWLACVVVVAWAVPASAQTYCYVKEGGTATGSSGCYASGAEPADLWSSASRHYDEPSSAEAVIGRVAGNTIWIADGNYNGVTFDRAASGNVVITVKKATIADHGSSNGWADAFGNGQSVFSGMVRFQSDDWTFDGNTDAFFTAYGFYITTTSTSIAASLVVGDIPPTIVDNITVRDTRANPNGMSNRRACRVNAATNTYMANVRCGDSDGDAFNAAGQIDGMTLEYMHIGPRDDDPTTNWHGDAFEIAGVSLNVVFRYSIVNFSGQGIFWGGNVTNSEWDVYGNVLTGGNSAKCADTQSGAVGVVLRFYNNTCYNAQTEAMSISGAVSGEIKNNIFFNTKLPQYGSTAHSHNAYGELFSGTPTETGFQTITAAIFNDVLNDDVTLASATNAGVTLDPPYDVDRNGNTRGEDLNWDRGAFEFGGTPAPPSITTGSPLPDGTEGVTYNQTLQRAGGAAPFTWTVTGGALPAGVTLGSSTGTLFGPPDVGSAGLYGFTVTLEDGNTLTDTETYALTIIEPPPPTGDGDASDTFETNGATLGPNWVNQTSNVMTVTNNEATGTGALARHLAYYDAEAFDPNQRSCGTLTSTPGGDAWHYAGVRMSGTLGSANAYVATAEPNSTVAAKIINGVRTPLPGGTITGVPWADGDQLCAEIDGSTLRVYRNAAEITGVGGIDSQGELTAGQPGIGVWGTATLDNFQAYNRDIVPDPPANVNPVAAFTTPAATGTTTATTQNIAGTCTDSDGTISAATVSVNGVSVGALAGTVDAWSKASVALVIGDNVFLATCTDNAAGTGQASVTITRHEAAPGVRRRVGRIR